MTDLEKLLKLHNLRIESEKVIARQLSYTINRRLNAPQRFTTE